MTQAATPIRTRRIVRLTVALVLAAALGPWLSGRMLSSGTAVHVEKRPEPVRTLRDSAVRIASWNLAHGRGGKLGETNWVDQAQRRQRLKSIGQKIREFDADVVVLNEVDFDTVWSNHEDQPSVIAEVAGYPHIVRQRNYNIVFPFARWRFGNAMLSRLPIVSAEFIGFEPRSGLESALAGNHDSVVVTLDAGKGRTFKVWAVHLEVRDEATRARAAEQIVGECDDLTVIAGDFNSSPTGFKVRKEAADGANAIDTLMASDKFRFFPKTDPNAATMTFPSEAPDRCIDWIVAPRSWRLVDGEVVQSDLSDHLPVVTEWQMVGE